MNSRKKTVIIDARMLNNSGIGRYTREIINACLMLSYEVRLIYNKESNNATEFIGLKNIFFKSPIYSIGEQIEYITKVPFCDLFISPHYNVPIILIKARKRLVVIPDVNHLVFNEGFSRFKKIYANFFYKYAVEKSNIVFTISEFSKREIIKYTNCNPLKIQVALLSIDKDYFGKLIQADFNNPSISDFLKLRYLLFVGNVKPHKNLKLSLQAFELLVKEYPNLKFLIVGKKEKLLNADKEVIDMVLNNSTLSNSVIFTGHISDSELAYLYKNAVCLVFASLYEGFGIPPLEAMFFDCPVLSSMEGSLPEICGDSVLYCDAYSVNDISDKIKLLLENNALRKELIQKGKNRLKAFDWTKFSNQLVHEITQQIED